MPPRPLPAACYVQRNDYLGDGWCDDISPYNTAACGWDKGDCCNIAVVNHACRDPASPNFGTLTATGLTFPAGPYLR